MASIKGGGDDRQDDLHPTNGVGNYERLDPSI